MSRVLAALLALVVILAGVLLYVASGTRRAGAAPTATAEIDAAPPPRAAELVPIPETEPASTPANSVAATAEPAQREAALTTHAEELTRALWVEGRVLFPEGTPLDEEVFVTADGRPFEDGSDHRVRVERDGAFRVAFSEKTRSGRLELAARYLYLPESVRWKRDETEPLVLEPALGGRIAVRVVAPDGTDPAQAGGKVLLHVEERDANTSWSEQRGARPLTPELATAFDALRPGNEYTLSYDGSAFIGSSRSVAVEAGETSSVEIALRPGVVLAGRVRDEAGTPLADVQVNGMSPGGTGFALHRNRIVETGADGTFRLGAFAPGEVTLQAQLDGFETIVSELEELEEGTTRSDLELTLRRGGSISGVVLWPDGTPAEAHLELKPRHGLDWDGSLREQSGKSDVEGRFRVSGLSAESYLVQARATKTEEVTVTSELTGRERKKKQRTPWSAELDRVKPGDDVELRLSSGLALSGHVLDERGAPLAEFRVSATRRLEMGMFPSLDGQVSKFFRDTGGAFLLEGLAPGEWQIVASGEEHARSEGVRVTIPAKSPIELRVPREARVSGVVLDARGEPCPRATVSAVQPGDDEDFVVFGTYPGELTNEQGAFQLERLRAGPAALKATGAAGAPSEPLELELVAGQEAAGIVLRLRTGANLVGELVGRDGSPEADVRVRLHCNDDHSEFLTTDAGGRFEARGLPPGEVYLQAKTRDGLELVQRLTLLEGETTRVRLAPPPGVLVRLRGRVRAGGEPLTDASVNASRSGWNDEEDGPRTTSSSAQSDEEGAYELTLPGAGRYELMVHSGNFALLSWSTTLDVPEVAEFVFDVEIALGRVSGRVTDGAGAALAGVWVESEPSRHEGRGHGGARTLTDEEGRYELRIPAGTHVVSAGGDLGWGADEAGQYVARRVEDLVVSENGHLRGIDFVLSTGGTLAGSVRAPDGTPVSWVHLWSSSGEGVEYIGSSEDDGSFLIRGLEPGTHWIRATQEGRATRAWAQAEIAAGETTRVELELVAATLVHVRVRDAGGAQVGCEIEVLDGEARPQPIESGEEPGEALVGPLPAGRYTVRARREEKLAERVLEIDATEPKLELELKFE